MAANHSCGGTKITNVAVPQWPLGGSWQSQSHSAFCSVWLGNQESLQNYFLTGSSLFLGSEYVLSRAVERSRFCAGAWKDGVR